MNEASVGFQCPECVSEGRRTTRQATGRFGGGTVAKTEYVTFALIAINVAVFLLDAVLSKGTSLGGFGIGGGGGFSPAQLYGAVLGVSAESGGTLYTGIADGAYYRLITADFVHFGLLHIALNMWALYVLGRYLERTLGHLRFAALYLVAGIGGNVAVYMFSEPLQLSAGASTSIFGLFVAVFFINRKLGRETTSIVVLLVINVMATFWVKSISIAGHIGGLVTGALLALGLAYAPRKQRALVQWGTFAVVLIVLAVLTVMRTQTLLDSSLY
ncbi:rhomboid family intramembrane serine protease [Phytomonospora endophytica]|uniref:Membrane associated rhomboid family serine protease n=1 Tax=Phytomonospora endophytica TaxID=714109 RepID=A0A841FRE3_9ACTN|nr:rhomboid family intramembrane serine protease [Phytomonospora endophytica]MBB6038384.1 membrane associated rhomboid family serine protease [Phytomonospora endophytica]GIG64315.1 rhomboid family intramembrane serine protease [Phytomonospora endophytica]